MSLYSLYFNSIVEYCHNQWHLVNVRSISVYHQYIKHVCLHCYFIFARYFCQFFQLLCLFNRFAYKKKKNTHKRCKAKQNERKKKIGWFIVHSALLLHTICFVVMAKHFIMWFIEMKTEIHDLHGFGHIRLAASLVFYLFAVLYTRNWKWRYVDISMSQAMHWMSNVRIECILRSMHIVQSVAEANEYCFFYKKNIGWERNNFFFFCANKHATRFPFKQETKIDQTTEYCKTSAKKKRRSDKKKIQYYFVSMFVAI